MPQVPVPMADTQVPVPMTNAGIGSLLLLLPRCTVRVRTAILSSPFIWAKNSTSIFTTKIQDHRDGSCVPSVASGRAERH